MRYEAIVVGAGPAGSATATHLARAGRSVLLVDRFAFPRDKPCAEYASPETEQALRRLGVWPALEAAGVARLRGMVIVSPSGRRLPVEYLDGDPPRRSIVLPRLLLDALLVDHARAAGVECLFGARVERPLVEDGKVVGVRVRGTDRAESEPRADLVVAADGLGSGLARSLGGGHAPRWPRRLGLATHYRDMAPMGEWGEMYVGRGGYCGLAPVGNGITTVAAAVPFTTAKQRAPIARLAWTLTDHPGLVRQLVERPRVKPFRGVGPLAWSVRRVAGPGFLLVGDAAGFFDPFTGEGLFRAVRGAEIAAELALEGLRSGDWEMMATRYQAQRQAALAAKERLARLIQVFVNCPPLLDHALARLERRPELAQQLAAALGDYAPASAALRPAYLAKLLKP